MAEPKWQELQIFNAKIAAYLETHRKTVGEFERSLRNSRHFIDLAGLAREKEPENTASLLEQIEGIDLLGYLNSQFDAFREISDLMPENAENQQMLEAQGEVEDLREKYESLLEEAELQQENMREMMKALEEIA